MNKGECFMNVTQRIFAIATEKRITLTELAEKIGISYGTIASWKRRGTQPPADKITTIAQALDVPVSYLLEGTEIESQRICNEHDSNAIVVTDKNEKLLIQNYRALHYARQIQVLSSLITEVENKNIK
jgi:transcriptional regulator with XRE-family HTH domain